MISDKIALSELSTPQLHELLRYHCQAKHKGSRGRRITEVEREIGKIKHILTRRRRDERR